MYGIPSEVNEIANKNFRVDSGNNDDTTSVHFIYLFLSSRLTIILLVYIFISQTNKKKRKKKTIQNSDVLKFDLQRSKDFLQLENSVPFYRYVTNSSYLSSFNFKTTQRLQT